MTFVNVSARQCCSWSKLSHSRSLVLLIRARGPLTTWQTTIAVLTGTLKPVKAVLFHGSQPPSLKPPEPFVCLKTYMLGARDAKHNHSPKHLGLSQTNAKDQTDCESTALSTEWNYHPITCEALPVCKLRNVHTYSKGATEQLTRNTSTTSATSLRAVHTRSDTSPPPRRARSPSPSDSKMSTKPQKFVDLAALEATVTPDTNASS